MRDKMPATLSVWGTGKIYPSLTYKPAQTFIHCVNSFSIFNIGLPIYFKA